MWCCVRDSLTCVPTNRTGGRAMTHWPAGPQGSRGTLFPILAHVADTSNAGRTAALTGTVTKGAYSWGDRQWSKGAWLYPQSKNVTRLNGILISTDLEWFVTYHMNYNIILILQDTTWHCVLHGWCAFSMLILVGQKKCMWDACQHTHYTTQHNTKQYITCTIMLPYGAHKLLGPT